jgi:hypothetical protein
VGVKRNDWIAVDRLWRRVTLCAVVNGVTEVTTDPVTDLPSLPGSLMVHVARPISCEAVAVGYVKAPEDRRSKL